MAESRINRNTHILIIVLLIMSIMTGCFMRENTRQTTYHDNVEELEQYILSELGDYIEFSEPSIGTTYSINEGYIEDEIVWHIVFLREYIYDTSKIAECSPGEVIAQFRYLYNSFMKDHSDYYLNDYYVLLFFNIPSKDQYGTPPYRECGYLSNKNPDSLNNKDSALTIVSLEDDYWAYEYNQSDIEGAVMMENSMDQIVDVADNMPNIKKIVFMIEMTFPQNIF